jgi:hypothetical protein
MYTPDYNNCILNIMGSIAKGFNTKLNYSPLPILKPAEIKEAKNVILIILDGLGYKYLIKYGKGSELLKHMRGKITSIFPAATTSCVPAFLTGTSTQESGMTGWYTFLREIGMIVVPLPYITRFGDFPLDGKVEFKKVFNINPFTNKINAKSYILDPVEFYDSAFNKESAGRAKLVGYNGISDFFKEINKIIRKNSNKKKYVYGYYPNPDTLMHEYGNENKKIFKEFKRIDREFKNFLKKIEGTNSIVIITADHGLITVPKKKWIDTHKYPKLNNFLRIPLCGEGRLAYAYIKPGKEKEFKNFINKNLNFCCSILKSEDAVERGLFGKGKPHPELKNRIGDYILIMKENYGIKDFLVDSDCDDQNLGRHGGVSAEEMFVPLIVVKA